MGRYFESHRVHNLRDNWIVTQLLLHASVVLEFLTNWETK